MKNTIHLLTDKEMSTVIGGGVYVTTGCQGGSIPNYVKVVSTLTNAWVIGTVISHTGCGKNGLRVMTDL